MEKSFYQNSMLIFPPLPGASNTCTFFFFFFFFKILFIYFHRRGREGGREGEKHRCQRESSICCLSYMHPPGPNLASDSWPCGTRPNQLSHHGQGSSTFLMAHDYLLSIQSIFSPDILGNSLLKTKYFANHRRPRT